MMEASLASTWAGRSRFSRNTSRFCARRSWAASSTRDRAIGVVWQSGVPQLRRRHRCTSRGWGRDARARGEIADGAVLWLCAPPTCAITRCPPFGAGVSGRAGARRLRDRGLRAGGGDGRRSAGTEAFKTELARYLALPSTAHARKSGLRGGAFPWERAPGPATWAIASCRAWAPSATPGPSRDS